MRLLELASRIGAWWYALPSLVVVLVGLATCHLIDATEFDRFDVERSIVHGSGTRAAVLVRQYHADSAQTVACLWIVAGPPPPPGPVKRLATSCVLVATEPDLPFDMLWQASGRLLVTLPAGISASTSDVLDRRCYFEKVRLGRHVCYWPQSVDIGPGR